MTTQQVKSFYTETIKLYCIVLYQPNGFCGRKATLNQCFGTGHSLSLICQPPSEDMKLYIIIILFD